MATSAEVDALVSRIRADVGTLAAMIPTDVVPPPPPPPSPPPGPQPIPTDEHAAVMALVPAATATLFVPTGEVKELSGAVSHIGVRVEGTLRLLDGCTLRLETLLTNHATFEVPAGATATISIRDTGPITDPFRLGRGCVFHGPVRIAGDLIIRSESTAIDRRGHVMFMTDDVEITGSLTVEDGGRTDKSKPITDFPDVTNLRGRYPFHVHQRGHKRPVRVNLLRIIRSPGWGAVNHSSWVEIERLETTDVFGAHFVSEHGDEKGYVKSAVCIGSTGSGVIFEDRTPGNKGDDVGHMGDGFWLQSAAVTLEDCTVSEMAGTAFAVQPGFAVPYPVAALRDPSILAPDQLVQGFYPGQPTTLPSFDVPLVMRRCKSFANRYPYALRIWGLHNPRYHKTDSVVEDCEFHRGGVFLNYDLGIQFRRVKITGDELNPLSHPFGPYAIDHASLNGDMVYEDVHIEGWLAGIRMPSRGKNFVRRGFYNCPRALVIDQADHLPREILIDDEQEYGPLTTQRIVYQLELFNWSQRQAEDGFMAQDKARLLFTNPTAEQDSQNREYPLRLTDVVKVGDLYLSPEVCAADFDLSKLKSLGLPAGMTTAQAAAAGMFVGGRKPLTQFERRSGIVGVLHVNPPELA